MKYKLKHCIIAVSFCVLITLFQHQCQAREIEVTKEWTLLGENDTIPAGMHVRMDMTTGEKWVKQIDESEEDSSASKTAAAVIQEDGSVQLVPTQQDDEETIKKSDGSVDYELMHRTLYKLPDHEKERIGGLPELPQSSGSVKITSKERQAFEKRMAEIWEQRQQELKELQELMLDLPEVLKERIKSIKAYLSDPMEHLKEMNLDVDVPDGRVTHIVSVLEDLEYQLGDLDNTRDFHTLGGWPLLASLVSEDVHLPQNQTIDRLSRRMEGKIRSIQALAAWALGTSVKNTEEFFPYAVEPFKINDSVRTTALDELTKAFCKTYPDPEVWEIRNLLGKAIYGIGALLRGNRLAQKHVVETGGAERIGKVFMEAAKLDPHLSDPKVLQKLLSLAGDVVSDIILHPETASPDLNTKIIGAFTDTDWCEATSHILEFQPSQPVPVQRTLLETVQVLAPFCPWSQNSERLKSSVATIRHGWEEIRAMFDAEHFEELNILAREAVESLNKSN